MGSENQNPKKTFSATFLAVTAAGTALATACGLAALLAYPFAQAEIGLEARIEAIALQRQIELLALQNQELAQKTRDIEARMANAQVVERTELVAPGVREATYDVQVGNICRSLVKQYVRDPATGMYDPADYRSDFHEKKGRCPI